MRLTLLILAVCLHVAAASAQAPEDDAVGRLRRALQATYSSAAARDSALQQCFSHLRTLSELQRAVSLIEWRETGPNEASAAVDRANRAKLVDWFNANVRRMLRQSDPRFVAAALEQLARLAAVERNIGGQSVTRPFGPDVVLVAIQGPASVRAAAARLLGQMQPDALVAVTALEQLLQEEDAELRQAAADGLVDLIRNSLQTVGELGAVVQRPAPRSELILLTSSVLPAIQRTVDDDGPQVRRRCPQAIGLAAAALTRLIAEPMLSGERRPNDASACLPPTESEREELRPLMIALCEQGSILARLLRDGDAEVRHLTHKALEDLGQARKRWRQRCLAAGVAMSEEDGLLCEVLQRGVPGLAEALGDEDARLRRSAADALEMLGPLAQPALPALSRALYDSDRFTRWSAVRTLGRLGPLAADLATPGLTRLLQDPDAEVRRAAAAALAHMNASIQIHDR